MLPKLLHVGTIGGIVLFGFLLVVIHFDGLAEIYIPFKWSFTWMLCSIVSVLPCRANPLDFCSSLMHQLLGKY